MVSRNVLRGGKGISSNYEETMRKRGSSGFRNAEECTCQDRRCCCCDTRLLSLHEAYAMGFWVLVVCVFLSNSGSGRTEILLDERILPTRQTWTYSSAPCLVK